MSFVAELEPKALWQHFDEILKIPRPSKKEDKMRDYVVGLANKHGLESKIDPAGNVVVKKPGMPGHENAPATVIQAHLDMVQEKNSDVSHDWSKDPILPQRDGAYLKATGTTLGSDCGVGVSSILAVMEATDVAHGPLELLFTIDEETGLTGAAELGDNMLESKQMINVDSEEEGVLTVGCAGGADTHLHLPVNRIAAPTGGKALAVKLSGFKGGHSGIDIHLQRGNAIKLLARALYAASLDSHFHLANLQGGNAHNAIPREASASLVVHDAAAAEAIRSALRQQLEAIREEFRSAEPEMGFQIDDAEAPSQVWDDATSTRMLQLINGLPHGVVSMSYDIPSLVETSTNLAVVSGADDKLEVLLSSRSSVASALAALRQRIRATGSLAGAQVTEDDGYPGWKPDMSSHMLEVVKQAHQELTGKQPEVGAVHAGLECGIIGEKYPGMDMISFGPQIEFPHSPDERVKIDSVDTFYKLLTKTLERLA